MSGDNFDYIFEQYRPLVKAAVGKYSYGLGKRGIDCADMETAANLALHRAWKSYDAQKKGITFGLYAEICVKNACISWFRKNTGKRAKHLKPEKTGRKTVAFSDGDLESLSTREKETVLMFFSEGLSYREIAEHMSVSVKSVDNALSRAKRKLKKMN